MFLLEHFLIWAAGYAGLHAIEHSSLLPAPRHVSRGAVLAAVMAGLHVLYTH